MDASQSQVVKKRRGLEWPQGHEISTNAIR
jgi:hypothetical protein